MLDSFHQTSSMPILVLQYVFHVEWKSCTYNWTNPTCMHVKNPLQTLYTNYFLFIIQYKVRIIEFWLVNFRQYYPIRAFLAYFKWDDMIYRSPNSIGSLFVNCPIRRTVTVKTHNIYKKQHGAQRLKYRCVEITECKLYMRVGDTKITSRVGENRRTWPAE